MFWDIGLIWDWQYDERFIKLFDSLCHKKGKKSYIISGYNLGETIEKIANGNLKFNVALDRATDCSRAYMPLVHILQKQGCRIIDDPAKIVYSADKAIMHMEFLRAGIKIPESIILFPKDEITEEKLDSIGRPFVVKPALGGGGEGVIKDAFSLPDIIRARNENPDSILLVQKKILPKEIDSERYWFRVFFVCGKVIPCFWNDLTHVFCRLSPSQEKTFKELTDIMVKINQITGLEFFSTEIAQSQNGDFFTIDYVNDQCDMRFQSDTPQGVQDLVIEEIIEAIIETL